MVPLNEVEDKNIDIKIKINAPKKTNYFWVTILLFGSGIFSYGLSATESISKACVSYETNKKMFKLNNVIVLGKTCNVKIDILTLQGENLPFRVKILSKDFDSGNGIRDKEVVEILGEQLVFDLAIPEKLWKDRLTLKEFNLKGKLTLKTGTFPVEFSVVGKQKNGELSNVLAGTYKGKFTSFGMEPPSVGPGGFVSDVSDDLILKFSLEIIK
jgi:hypothetical protein